MAAGQLLHFAESVFSLRFADFASALQNPLSVDAWGRLRQEWSKAAAFVCENLKIRLGFYQSLPWIILGGTHADPAKARKCLQEAQSLWHDLPEDARSMQHVMAQELFSPGPLRDDLQRFVSDCEPLNACPRLEEYLAPLTFVQIAERIIEGAHKDLGTLPKRHSMTALSIQLRAPELNRSLPLKPDSFESLLEQFVIARKVRRFSDVFPCFKAHPLFQALARQRRRAPSRAHLKVLRSILYRDATVQHGDLRESVQWHKSQKKLLDQAKLAFVPKEPKTFTGFALCTSRNCVCSFNLRAGLECCAVHRRSVLCPPDSPPFRHPTALPCSLHNCGHGKTRYFGYQARELWGLSPARWSWRRGP